MKGTAIQRKRNVKVKGTVKKHEHLRIREVLGEFFMARTGFGNGAEGITSFVDLVNGIMMSVVDATRLEVIASGHRMKVRDGITTVVERDLCQDLVGWRNADTDNVSTPSSKGFVMRSNSRMVSALS